MHKSTLHHHKLSVMALSAVIAALIAGGCTQTDEPNGGGSSTTGEGVVTFGAYVSGTSATRASVSNINTLKQSGFGVFASITGLEDFQDNPASGGFTPNYMYNQKVTWQGVADGDGTWTYEPELLWPGMQKVSFFAYAPYTDKANRVIKNWSGINDSGSPRITFSLGSDIGSQVDILYANAQNLVNSPEVPLNFKHALSRISFRSTVGEIDSNTTLVIKKLTFKSTDLGTDGELNLGTGKWTNITGTIQHEFTTADAMERGFLVIPPDKESTMEITVEYTMTTTDSNLPSGSFKSDEKACNTFTLRPEQGMSYCLDLLIGLSDIKVSASINKWPDDNHTWESDQDHGNKLD